jgi:hypothetical protein
MWENPREGAPLSIPEQYMTEDNTATITYEHPSCKARLWGRPVGQLPGKPTFKRHQEVTGMIGNMALVNSDFLNVKDFSKNYPQFGHVPSKMFASPVLG